MTPKLNETVGDAEWLDENRKALLNMLPETWTHVANVNFIALRYQLKLIGVDFRSDNELAFCLAALEKASILQRSGILLRRHP